jgi:putative phosphoesterase
LIVKVGIISDTHGFVDPRVVEVLAGCDVVVHGGDVGSSEVLDAIARACPRVIAVVGNNDVPSKWIGAKAALPREARVELPGGSLVVVHGDRVLPVARRHDRLRAMYPDAHVVVYGHSHRRVIDTTAEPWIVNPGAAGRARTYGGPSVLVLSASRRRWTIEEQVFEPMSRARGSSRRRSPA